MGNIKVASTVALLLVASLVWAENEDTMAEKPAFSASQTMIVSAVVEAINHETRVVTVRKADGEAITFTASDEARNLDQVKVGDTLIATYKETVSVAVMANERIEADEATASAMARSDEGEMPGFAAMESSVTTATVEAINLELNTFKLKWPNGTVNEYTARNPENLKRAAVGDLVVITVTEAVALTVQSQPAE
jgi:hypothetical protein